jgi:hypothetical protein
MTRWFNFDLRTTRGQNKCILVAYAISFFAAIVVLTTGESFCVRV